ncbi:MAG TPA: hypothetical protein ENJ99_04395 [Rhizobiales bacterium]|nr:hypothetical protein [Hyphomicrobiales bacterium]
MTQVAYLDAHYTGSMRTGKMWAAAATFNTFDQDTVLDREAFRQHPVLVVKSGAIGLQHMLGDGRQTISVIYFEDEVIDFRYLGRVSGKLVCILPVTACLYKGDDFDAMKHDNPQFEASQSAGAARQQYYAAQHSVDLARKSAIEKLASFILECRKRQNLGRALTVSLRLRRTDIADYMGLRVETLSRAFSKLKKMQLIDADETDEIFIRNEPALRQLANGRTIGNRTCWK